MFFLLLGAVMACSDPPEYPLTPRIEFESLRFEDSEDPSLPDSLILSIRFQDGDGDLGLSDADSAARCADGTCLFFNSRFYFTKNGTPLTYYIPGECLTYADKRLRPALNLPDYVRPYTCINWEIRREEDGRIDTAYFELNENHYNIFVEFYVKQNDGSFQRFSWRDRFCTTFDGRFPVIARNVSDKSPLTGVIHYAMTSVGFKIQFSIRTLKLKVRIQDRMQRMSNEIETPEFQF